MTTLPIRRIILYKHGVGYFERRGTTSGEYLRLSFPRAAMDDMLKSLIALDMGAGQVLSIDFETPENRAALLEKGSIHLSPQHSLLDLLRDLRGRRVRVLLAAHDDDDEEDEDDDEDEDEDASIEGLVVGVDYEEEEPLKRALLTLYLPQQRSVQTLPLRRIGHVELLDDTAAADLDYFLRAAQSEEERRHAALHLSSGEHDLLVGYIAPAPAWRVSYRMLVEPGDTTAEPSEASGTSCSVLLQGWGLFDNQLEEDLEDVHLTLVAGMPVSFRYRLYEPHTPERPLIEDEDRTVNAPLFFESAPPPAAPQKQAARRSAGGVQAFGMAADAADEELQPEAMAAPASFSAAEMEESVQVTASGSERGALFAYEVGHPVSVGRGQSAMVPIASQRIPCRRDLLYNRHKLPRHPVASLRLTNDTGLTLERGPVTVLEDGAYAGEAVVPFTQAGGELIVPFAVELGITVDEQQRGERHIAGISVRDDYLLIHEYDVRHTTYHLSSTLAQAVSVTIEHPRRSTYDLADTPAPREEGAHFARWEVECAPGERTTFEVHERRLVSRHEQVRSLTGDRIHRYVRNRWLDGETAQALAGVTTLYHQIQQLQQQRKRIEREREGIYKQQKQIQGNLAPLANEGGERALRARYVSTLNTLEDKLAELATEEQRLQQQIDDLEQQASERIRALSEQETDESGP
jgi:hypothetical protein